MPSSRDFQILQERVDKALLVRMDLVERGILATYLQALDDIRVSLSKVYEKYAVDGVLTRAEMTRYNRMSALEAQIKEIVQPVLNSTSNQAVKTGPVVYNEAFFRTAWAIDQNAGVALKWGLLNPDAVRAAVQNDFTELAVKKLKTDGLLRTQRVIRQGITQGMSYPKMAGLIKDQLIKPSAYDALRIARTEGQRAAALGKSATMQRAEDLGVDMTEIWVATLDGKTRPEHRALDGKPKDAEHDGWYVPGIGWIPGPLQSGDPSFDINCRCTTRGEINGYPPSVRRSQEGGLIPYQSYEQWQAA